MESLPNEILVKIVSFLSFKQQVSCRKVSRVFKHSVDLLFRDITHIRIRPVYADGQSKSLPFSAAKFMSGPFVQVEVSNNDRQNLFNFISDLCPNIEVLDASYLSLTSDELYLIAKNVRYFVCDTFVPCRDVTKTFKHLKGLHLLKSPRIWQELSLLIAKNCVRNNEKVVELCYPRISDAVDIDTLKSIENVGVENLTVTGPPNQFRPLSQNLTQQLVSLTISFIPRIGFCEGSFCNLKNLYVKRSEDKAASDQQICRKLFFTSSQLRTFHFYGSISATLFVQLMQHLSSLPNLYLIEFRADIEVGDAEEEFILPFPTNIKFLNLVLAKNMMVNRAELLNYKIEPFHPPNLEHCTLHLECISSNLCELLMMCHKLKSLSINCYSPPTKQQLEDLLYLLTFMFHLKVFTITNSTRQFVQGESDPLILKADDFVSVNHLSIDCKMNIIFHPCDVFQSLELGTRLQFKNSTQNKLFEFHQQQFVNKIVFSDSVTQMEHIKLECSPWNFELYSDLIHSLHKFCNLKFFSINWASRMALDQFELVMRTLPTLKHLNFVSLNHSENSVEQFVHIEFKRPSAGKTNIQMIYYNWQLNLYGDLNPFLPSFTDLHRLEVTWGHNISRDQVQSLLKILPQLTRLEEVKLFHHGNSKRGAKVKKSDRLRLEQAKIPSVTRFIWGLNLKVFFLPKNAFETLKIGQSVVLQSKSGNIFYEFTSSKSCRLVLKEKMNLLKEIEVDTSNPLYSRIKDQKKYLKGVPIVKTEHSFVSTPSRSVSRMKKLLHLGH